MYTTASESIPSQRYRLCDSITRHQVAGLRVWGGLFRLLLPLLLFEGVDYMRHWRRGGAEKRLVKMKAWFHRVGGRAKGNMVPIFSLAKYTK